VSKQPVRAAWRLTLALLYPLATIVALVGHDHGHHDANAPLALASCESGGLHLADHPDAPDLGRHGEPCTACLFTSQNHALLASPPADIMAEAGSLAFPSLPPGISPDHRPTSARGPPVL
jgi:hypothetical protein